MEETTAKIHCGKTRSGKVITYRLADEDLDENLIQTFEAVDDDFDAYAAFTYLSWAEVMIGSKDGCLGLFQRQIAFFEKRLSSKIDIVVYQRSLGIHDLSGLLAFGKKRITRRTS